MAHFWKRSRRERRPRLDSNHSPRDPPASTRFTNPGKSFNDPCRGAAPGSARSLFGRAGRRRNPLEGNGPFLLGLGGGRGRRSRGWLVALGNGHILGTLRARDDKTDAGLIDHHALPARPAEKVNVDRSSSRKSSAIDPNRLGCYPVPVPVARKEMPGVPHPAGRG